MDWGHRHYISAGKWMLCKRPRGKSLLIRADVSSGGWSVNSDMLYLNEHRVHILYTRSLLPLLFPLSVSLPLVWPTSLLLQHLSLFKWEQRSSFLSSVPPSQGSLPSPALFLRTRTAWREASGPHTLHLHTFTLPFICSWHWHVLKVSLDTAGIDMDITAQTALSLSFFFLCVSFLDKHTQLQFSTHLWE